MIDPPPATRAELSLCHEGPYLDSLESGSLEFVQRDMYISDHAQLSSQLACGCAIAAAMACVDLLVAMGLLVVGIPMAVAVACGNVALGRQKRAANGLPRNGENRGCS